MMKNISLLIFYYTVILCIVLLFGYTAVTKLLEQDIFILQMQLAPAPLMKFAAPILAWTVPLAEALIIAALFFERLQLLALKVTVALMTIFTLYITTMMLSGLDLPCTCGGIISTLSWKNHLFLNISFIATTGIAIKLHQRIRRIENQIDVKKRTKDITRASA